MLQRILVLAIAMTLVACGDDETKKTTTPTTTCTSGNTRCSNNVLQTCVNSAWNAGTTCGVNTCTTDSATTAHCASASNNNNNNSTGDCTVGTTSWTCDGDVVLACDGESTSSQVYLDCSDILGDGSVSGVCHDFGGEWQADCLLEEGDPCYFSDGENAIVVACGAGSTPSGTMVCDVSDGCVTGTGTCTPSETYVPACEGNRLIYACADFSEIALKVGINCASADFGSGTCNTTDGMCEHSTVDAYCDNEIVRCVGSTTCDTTNYKCVAN